MAEATSALLAPPEGGQVEQVGQFTMTFCQAQASAESEARWSRRAEALSHWLQAEWRRERAEDTGITIATSRGDKETDAPLFAGGEA